MFSVGAGGPITGRGADYLKADDLIKGYQEAQSETLRENTWQWWTSVFRTRLMPGGIILVIGTRWHEDDIIGRLLAAQGDSPEGMKHRLYSPDADRFLRIRLPALAEEPDEDFPEPDPLGREPGEPLFPEMWPIELLKPHMANQTTWAALYQQRPTPKEGGLFHEDWFEIVSHPGGKFKKLIRRWDLAATEPKKGTDPDYTVGVLLGEHENGLTYILDVERFRGTPHTVESTLKRVRDTDGRRVRIRYEEEPGSAGKMTTYNLARRIYRGYPFRGVRSTGDKWLRAEVYAGALERGEIKLVRGAWNKEFIREHTRFTRRALHDDQVDASAGGYSDLVGKGTGKVVTW
jgi:predicted phage terminase large subunit-like protein